MQREFGLNDIGALTWPLVDIAKVRRDLGEHIWIYGSVADEIVKFGTPDTIYEAVRELMESGAKGKGRFALGVGDLLRGTPMENREAFYEAVKEFGRY
jgi:uroporphyrinogen-III decarboxylase